MVSEIKLTIRKNINCKGEKIGPYFYENDCLFFKTPYPFPCKLKVKGLDEVTATPAMLKLPNFLTYHNVDFLRQQLFQIKCIQSNSVMLHGSAWYNGEGHLAVGFPDSGKTTIVLNKVWNGATFGSDESVVVDENLKIHPIKRTTSLNPWLAKGYPLSARQRFSLVMTGLRAKVFPIFEPNIWIDLPYKRHSFKLSHLHYLIPGRGKSLKLLTDNEYPFMTNSIIQAYSYATGFDLEKVYNKYIDLLKNIEENCIIS